MDLAYIVVDVPCPASLEKIPREKPFEIVIIIVAPANPPIIGVGLKA